MSWHIIASDLEDGRLIPRARLSWVALVMLILAAVVLAAYPPPAPPGAAADWQAAALLDVMLRHGRGAAPLRAAVVSRRPEFQPGLLLLEAARRGVRMDRDLANRTWEGPEALAAFETVEFIVTDTRGSLSGELPWQRRVREWIETNPGQFEKLGVFRLPDGSTAVLFMKVKFER